MKTLSILVLAIALSISASAQSDTTSMMKHHDYAKNHHEYYYMKDGKMMMDKNGQRSEVMQDVTLKNGTVIKSTGEVDWTNGKSETLKEGERVDMYGKIHNTSMNENRKWKNKNSMHSNSMNGDSTQKY